ncbi:histidinol-phosphate transaminase [Saccharopolyspora sp. NPDC050389]|uniref:histidinol-phosphate transaminase n=1 Tax=Saccharopolyspora sp. NPDC050389 TaxID=3155516 RepID=UPI0033F27539
MARSEVHGAGERVRVRPDLAGRGGYRAGEIVPGSIKLSSNESGHPPLPGVLEAVRAASAEANRYPDNHATVLRAALAERWAVTSDDVIIGCGSSLLCQELVQATCEPGDAVAFGWRSFEAYRLYARTAHARAITVPNTPDGRLDLPALAAACANAEQVGVVFLCSPNNPTGAVITDDELTGFLDAVPRSVPVVVDEAYAEFATGVTPHAIDWYRAGWRNVVMLRTFSKAYGLAGLRVGYAIGAPELLGAVHAIRSPFNVSAVAQAAAIASLQAVDEMDKRVVAVAAGRLWVTERLRRLGLPVQDSEANFLWLPLGVHADEFAEHCRHEGVVVRSFPPDGARVTISVQADNERLVHVARSWRLSAGDRMSLQSSGAQQ